MSIDYSLHTAPFDDAFVERLEGLAHAVFGETIPLAWRLASMPDVSVFVAARDGTPVGFKIGYAMTESKFYSWLGGVDPAHRAQGVASELARRQHRWTAGRGYRLVETSTDVGNHAMTRLNLRQGFAICGTRNEPRRLQVLFIKTLSPEAEGE